MVTSGLFIHSHYENTILSDTDYTVFLKMLALNLDYHQTASFYGDRLPRISLPD